MAPGLSPEQREHLPCTRHLAPPAATPHVLSPLEDIEDTDGQVAEGKDQQHHHQHLGRLPPSPHLLHLGQEGTGPRRGLCTRALPLVLQLVRGPLPVPHQGRGGARDLSSTHTDSSGGSSPLGGSFCFAGPALGWTLGQGGGGAGEQTLAVGRKLVFMIKPSTRLEGTSILHLIVMSPTTCLLGRYYWSLVIDEVGDP